MMLKQAHTLIKEEKERAKEVYMIKSCFLRHGIILLLLYMLVAEKNNDHSHSFTLLARPHAKIGIFVDLFTYAGGLTVCENVFRSSTILTWKITGFPWAQTAH